MAYLLHVYDYDEKNGNISDCNKRKLAELLAEDTPNLEAGYMGNLNMLRENSKRIVKLIDDAGTIQKSIYYANLTRATLNDCIDRNKFFKLCNCVRILTEEDLSFLANDVQKTGTSTIEGDKEFIDDFRAVGLLIEVEGGFAYTLRAFELLKYCLAYEGTVSIPGDIQRRMVMSAMKLEDIEKAVSGDTIVLNGGKS